MKAKPTKQQHRDLVAELERLNIEAELCKVKQSLTRLEKLLAQRGKG